MPLITIRGQYESGAPEIGQLVAKKLGGDYVDREIIARVAEKLNLEHEHVVAKEQPPGGLWGRIAHALEHSMAYGGDVAGVYAPVWQAPTSDAHYVDALVSVIKELGEDHRIVIRGRGSRFILKDHPRAFHVLVVAPLAVRIARTVAALKVDEATARKEIGRSESSHRMFIKRYFNADLEDPVNYDLTINTGQLSHEAAATIIVDAAARCH